MLGNYQHNPNRIPRVLKSTEEMTEYFRARIAMLKDRPQEGLIQSLLSAEIDGDRLTEEEVIANTIVTMVGGQETTTNLIGNGILTLLRNPGEKERLMSDYSLIPSAVEELLRYESPSQQTGRIAQENVDIGGQQIKKGQAVIAVIASGNRDPTAFPSRIRSMSPVRQSPSGVWLGGAFLLRCAARPPRRSNHARYHVRRCRSLNWKAKT